MQHLQTLVSQPKLWRRGLALGAAFLIMGAAAYAQNIDQGKSASRLFSDSCATCHRSARGLSKGRFHLTLFLFLQKHYASDSGAAWQLTSYLESLEGPRRGRSKTAAVNLPSSATSTHRSSIRPPMPVPQR
jgi:mono/diheme cytochrome c family protein